jgi:hypothetical protein
MPDMMPAFGRRTARCGAALVALALCWPDSVGAAGRQDPMLLSCTFPSGRSIGGIVVFNKLKKLRIWYGDGGGEEWEHVDFTKDPITTSSHQDEQSLVLSADYKHVTLNMGDEHSNGECQIQSTAHVPKNWLAPVLRQY